MIRHWLATMAVLVLATPVAAQDLNNRLVWEIQSVAAVQNGTSLNGGGEVAMTRGVLQVGATYFRDRRNAFGISFSGGVTDYRFKDVPAPWGTVQDATISLPLRFGFSDTGSAIIVPSWRYYAEEGASDDTDTYGVLAGAIWRVSDALSIGPGFGAFSRLDDDMQYFPILLIDWSITDRIALSTGRGLGATQGPGLQLTYDVNDDLKLGLAGRYEDLEFRLDDRGTAPGGIGRDRAYPVVASVEWAPNPGFRASGFIGAEFDGQLTLRDENDKIVDRREYDVAPIFGGSVSFRF